MAVAVAGSYAYVADYGHGMTVIDVSDPEAPFEVGFYGFEYSTITLTSRLRVATPT